MVFTFFPVQSYKLCVKLMDIIFPTPFSFNLFFFYSKKIVRGVSLANSEHVEEVRQQ